MLEKHDDFFRDFRGDTLHPSTLELMAELGWLEDVLALPHTRVERATVSLGGETVVVGRFDRLPVRCPFIAFLPQWDFLELVATAAEAEPCFRLLRGTEVVGAWQWLPAYDVGVAAEISESEAFSTLRYLTISFAVIGGA